MERNLPSILLKVASIARQQTGTEADFTSCDSSHVFPAYSAGKIVGNRDHEQKS